MSRYLLLTFSIGVGAAVIASLAYLLGAFNGMSEALRQVYVLQGVFGEGEVTPVIWLEILLTVVVTVGATWAVVEMPGLSRKGLVVLSCVLLLLTFSPVLALHNWLFDPAPAALGVVLGSLGGYLFSRSSRGMRKGVLLQVLGNRVSHDTFLSLLDGKSPLPLEPRVQQVTVLSCRLLNEAEMREKLAPEDWVSISNFFLRSVEAFLVKEGAYVDEAHPENLRASFGVLGESTEAEKACATALLLQSRLRNFTRECETRWFQPLVFGIGLESGEVVSGVFGDRHSARFSAVGGIHQLSYRLAGANPAGVEGVVVGPGLFSLVGNSFEFRPLEMFYDPAEGRLHEIYHLLDHKKSFSEEAREGRDFFWKGMILLREKKYEEALEAFLRSRAVGGREPTLDYFVGKMQEQVSQSGNRGFGTRDEDPRGGHSRLMNRL